MIKFLAKEPDKALSQIKEELYSRLKEVSDKFSEKPELPDSYLDGYEDRMAEEHNYLLRLLDVFERS